MLDNNPNDINELIKKLDNKLVSNNICLNLPSDDIDLNLDIILDFPKSKVKDEKHTIDIKNNEINLEVNNNIKNDNNSKDDYKLKSKNEGINNLNSEKKKNKIENNDILSDNKNINDNKSLNSCLNEDKENNKNEITEVQEEEINNKNEIIDNRKEEEEKRIIKEEELRREKEDREREKEEDERRKNEEEKRKKREMERKEIEKEKKKKEEIEKEEKENKINEVEEEKKEELEKEEKENKINEIEEKKEENSICIQSENSIKPIDKKNKNSKIFMSLSEEQKNDYLYIINDIKNLKSKDNNIKDIDIDKYPTIVLDLNQKEETLDDIIPNFKKIIKQNENEIEKRKHNFISHNYFEWIIEASPLLELIPECKISHVDLLNNIYNEEGLHNIPEINDDYEELIFENEIISENNSPIGNVEDLKSFIYKYNFEKNTKVAVNSLKSFNFWRNIDGDGNSFYRSFMFSLLEYYILNNNLNELNEIISEITSNQLLEIYKKQELDYKIPFIILGAILKLLSNNNIEKAYDLFFKSYLLKDACFDKLLIIYLKYISYKYVDEVIELSKEQNQPNIHNNLNKELINTMNIEPSFFIICLMPYLYDINIHIFWLDKDLIQCKDGVINFIDEENTVNLPLISLGYFFSSYHIIYSVKSKNEFINKIFNSKSNNLLRLTCQINNKDKCQICKGQKYIIFLKKNFKVCKNCLEKYINKISSFRNESLNNDNYIGQEYYSRPFHLKDNYFLNDFEFIEIKEEVNIINYLQHTASIVCSKCKGNFDKKNLNNLKCKCLLCDKCLEEMILDITGGLKILNSYEKRNLQKTLCTSCGGDFSYEDALEHLKDIKEKDRKNAINRMKNYISTKCLICGTEVRKNENTDEFLRDNFDETEEDNNNNQKNKYIELKKYRKIKIRKENDKRKGIDYLDIEHVICYECYEKNMINSNISYSKGSVNNNGKRDKEESNSGSSDDEDNKFKRGEYYVDFEEGECFCLICSKKHYLIDKSVRNGGCCSSGCIIN